VATVSSQGVLTAVAFGATTLTVKYAGTTTTTAVSVVAVSLTTVTSCQTISAPGPYAVANDIGAGLEPPATCISIDVVQNVQLDCQNHVVMGLSLSHVSGVTVTNCLVPAPTRAFGTTLTNVAIDHNSSLNGWSATGSTGLRVTNNHFVGEGVNVFSSTGSLIQNNAFDQLTEGAYAINMAGGSNNQISGNSIDGGYDGSGQKVGMDDGILLTDEAGDLVAGNTIANVWDAGVEGVDSVTNTTISANVIHNAGVAGVAAYWCTSWSEDTVSANNVSQSIQVMLAYFAVGSQCPNPSSQGGFHSNRITGNTFRNQTPGPPAYGLDLEFQTLADAAVSQNVIQGNDLGGAPGPKLFPTSGFINGGGNICPPTTSPFCGGP